MIPYIAVLIILIVVILYQVYATVDNFTASSYADLYRQRYGRDASGNSVDASGSTVSTRDASGTTVVVTTKDASGNTVKDASGNEIRLSLSELFGLLGPFKTSESKPASVSSDEKPAAPVITPTSESIKEIENRIAKAVSKQVKDDLMTQRAMEDVYDKYAPCDLTDSEAQGQEYTNVKPRPSSQPDMSEYIRKDSIPCWNCSVP